MTPKHQIITSRDGTKLWAEAAGDPSKPAVIFVHGFAGSASHFEVQFSDVNLLRNLHLVRYDLRGHGRSDQPLTADSYASVRHAEDHQAVCDAFGLKRPFLASWSFGGLVAADVCAAYGADSISGNILLAAIPYLAAYPAIVNPFIQELSPRLFSSDVVTFSKACADFADSCVSEGFPVSDETKWLWAGIAATQHPLVRPLILGREQDDAAIIAARKTLPFLVLQGTADKHLLVDKVEDFMRSHFDRIEFHRMEAVGHALFYEQPEFVNSTILAFIQKIAAQLEGETF